MLLYKLWLIGVNENIVEKEREGLIRLEYRRFVVPSELDKYIIYNELQHTWVLARLCKLQNRCTRLATESDQVYQLLAHWSVVLFGYSGFFHH